MTDFELQLINAGFSSEQVETIVSIHNETQSDLEGNPTGTIVITFSPSRSRIGTSLLAHALKSELEKMAFDVEYLFMDYENTIYSDEIQEKLKYIYTKEGCSFKHLCFPRAKIILKVPENASSLFK